MKRRLWIVIVGLMLHGVVSLAQTNGFAVHISPTPDPYGIYQVTIRNTSKMNITAVQIFRLCPATEEKQAATASMGFDALLQFGLAPTKQYEGMPPGTSRQFDVLADEVRCPGGVSVMFSDGHGEGSEDGPYGWRQVILNRKASYEELKLVRGIVSDMPDEVTDYPKSLLDLLEPRRLGPHRDGTLGHSLGERSSRDQVLDALLRYLRQAGSVPGQLKSKEQTLLLLDGWMATLTRSGFADDLHPVW